MLMRVYQPLFAVTPDRTRRQALGVGLGMLQLRPLTKRMRLPDGRPRYRRLTALHKPIF